MTLRGKNFYLRTVAAFTTIIFFWNSFAWPLPEVSLSDGGVPSLLIPKELGTIEEYQPISSSSLPFVIHIQDLHAAPEAQEKIRDILKFLHSKKKLLVAVEGAAGALHPEYLDFFPSYPRVTNALVQDLVSESMLTGPALFAWERYESKPPPRNDDSVQFIGVETPRLYRQNLQTYRDFFKNEEKIQQDLKSFRASLESAQTKIFNPDLRKFVQEVQRRKEGKFQSGKASPDLAAYIRFLADSSRGHLGIDLRDKFEQIRFPNFTRILFLMEFESKITAHQRRVLHSEIESKKLFDEIAVLEIGIREKLVKKPQEAKLLKILDDFKLLEKLFHLELTREEYHQLVKRISEINPANLHQRLATFTGSSLPLRGNDVDSAYETALRFYRFAARRDKALLQKALHEASKIENSSHEKPVVVLITGGFHTSGVKELLKEKKIPYAVVTPALAKIKSDQSHYHNLMSGKMFAKEASSALPDNNNLVWAQILTARDQYPSLNPEEDQRKIFSHAAQKAGEYFHRFYPQISETTLREILSHPSGFLEQTRAEVRSEESRFYRYSLEIGNQASSVLGEYMTAMKARDYEKAGKFESQEGLTFSMHEAYLIKRRGGATYLVKEPSRSEVRAKEGNRLSSFERAQALVERVHIFSETRKFLAGFNSKARKFFPEAGKVMLHGAQSFSDVFQALTKRAKLALEVFQNDLKFAFSRIIFLFGRSAHSGPNLTPIRGIVNSFFNNKIIHISQNSARSEVRSPGIPPLWKKVFGRLDNLNRQVWKKSGLDIIDASNQLKKELVKVFGPRMLYEINTWNPSVEENQLTFQSGPYTFEWEIIPNRVREEAYQLYKETTGEKFEVTGYTIKISKPFTPAEFEGRYATEWGMSEREGSTLLEIPVVPVDRTKPLTYIDAPEAWIDKERNEMVVKQEVLFSPGEDRIYQVYLWRPQGSSWKNEGSSLEKTVLEKRGERTYAVWRTPRVGWSFPFTYVALHSVEDLSKTGLLIQSAEEKSDIDKAELQYLHGPVWRNLAHSDLTIDPAHLAETPAQPSVFEDLKSAWTGKRISALLSLAIKNQSVREGEVFSRLLLAELEKLGDQPYGRKMALGEIAEMNSREAREKFSDPLGDSGALPAIMALVAALAPGLLDEMKDWDEEVYEALKKVVENPDLKELFEEGEVRFHEADLPTATPKARSFLPAAVVFSRLKDRQVVIPIHLGSAPQGDDGKVWFRILDMASLGIENSDSVNYQVYDHLLEKFYPAVHSGAKFHEEGWRIGIPVVKGKADYSGFVQNGWHFQVLEIRKIGPASLQIPPRAEVRTSPHISEKIERLEIKNDGGDAGVDTNQRPLPPQPLAPELKQASVQTNPHPPFLMSKPTTEARTVITPTTILPSKGYEVKKLLAYPVPNVTVNTFNMSRWMKSRFSFVRNGSLDSTTTGRLTNNLNLVNKNIHIMNYMTIPFTHQRSEARPQEPKRPSPSPFVANLLERYGKAKLEGLTIAEAARLIRVDRITLWVYFDRHPGVGEKYGIKPSGTPLVSARIERYGKEGLLQELSPEQAARLIKLSRSTVYDHLKKHPEDFDQYGIRKDGTHSSDALKSAYQRLSLLEGPSKEGLRVLGGRLIQSKIQIPLKGLQLGKTNSQGQTFFNPIKNYRYKWSALGFPDSDWDGVIKESWKTNEGFEQFLVEWAKENHNFVYHIYQIGPYERILNRNDLAKGTTQKVLRILSVDKIENLAGREELRQSTKPSWPRRLKGYDYVDMQDLGALNNDINQELMETFYQTVNELSVREREIALSFIESDSNLTQRYTPQEIQIVREKLKEKLSPFVEEEFAAARSEVRHVPRTPAVQSHWDHSARSEARSKPSIIPKLLEEYGPKLRGLNLTQAAKLMGVDRWHLSSYSKRHPEIKLEDYGIQKKRRTPKDDGRAALSQLVIKPSDFDWTANAAELPDLTGLSLGVSIAGGRFDFFFAAHYLYAWRALGSQEAGWKGVILQSGVRQGIFEFTAEFSKQGREPFQKTFQVGPYTMARSGIKTEKGKKATVLEINESPGLRALGERLIKSKTQIPLKGLRLGKTVSLGRRLFNPIPNYRYNWSVLGFAESEWDGVIKESWKTKEGFEQFLAEWTKADHVPLYRTYQIGPYERTLYGSNRDKGTTRQVYWILSLEDIARLSAKEELRKNGKTDWSARLGAHEYVDMKDEGSLQDAMNRELMESFHQIMNQFNSREKEIALALIELDPGLLQAYSQEEIQAVHQKLREGLRNFSETEGRIPSEKSRSEVREKVVASKISRQEAKRLRAGILEILDQQESPIPLAKVIELVRERIPGFERIKKRTVQRALLSTPVLKGHNNYEVPSNLQEGERLRAAILDLLDRQTSPIRLARVVELVRDNFPEFEKVKDHTVGDLIRHTPILVSHPNYSTREIDYVKIQVRRDTLFSIVENQEMPKTPEEYTRLLSKALGYEVKVGTIYGDFRWDPRFRDHPHIEWRVEQVKARRDKLFEILNQQIIPITKKRLEQLLRQVPGYENMRDEIVIHDTNGRWDARFKDHPKLLAELSGIKRAKTILSALRILPKELREKIRTEDLSDLVGLGIGKTQLGGMIELEYPWHALHEEGWEGVIQTAHVENGTAQLMVKWVKYGMASRYRFFRTYQIGPAYQELKSNSTENGEAPRVLDITMDPKHPQEPTDSPHMVNRFLTKEEALDALRQREAQGLSNEPLVLMKALRKGGDSALYQFVYDWNRHHPDDRISLPPNGISLISGLTFTEQDLDLVLREELIYGLTEASPDYPGSLFPYQLTVDPAKEKEAILKALEKRTQEGGESANYDGRLSGKKSEDGDRSLYQRIKERNRHFPNDPIILPRNPEAHRHVIYPTKESMLEALQERKALGLENTSTDLNQSLEKGGDITLLHSINGWNNENPNGRIVLDKKVSERAERLDPFILWGLQAQNYEATDEERTEWWRALQEGDHEAGKKLAESFIPIVDQIAQKLRGKDPHYAADMVQNGNLIVLETIYSEKEEDKWNPSKGLSLTEFVETRLKEKMRGRTLEESRSSGRYSLDAATYRDGERKGEPSSLDPLSREERINKFADERDEASGLPMIMFEEKHRIARELKDWFIQQGLVDWANRRGISNLSITTIGSFGAVGAAIRGISDLNLMVVTDATESQAEDLKDKIKDMTGGREGVLGISELAVINVGKELKDYEEAVNSQNGFVRLLLSHGIGKDFRHGIASIEIVRLTKAKQTAKFQGWTVDETYPDADPFHRQKTRAGFYLNFLDEQMLEHNMNGIPVLENAAGATTRLAKTLPAYTPDITRLSMDLPGYPSGIYEYYQRVLGKAAANIRKAQNRLLGKEEDIPSYIPPPQNGFTVNDAARASQKQSGFSKSNGEQPPPGGFPIDIHQAKARFHTAEKKEIIEHLIPGIEARFGAKPVANRILMDIGAGSGDLTKALDPHFGKIYAVELDAERAQALRELNNPSMQVIESDFFQVINQMHRQHIKVDVILMSHSISLYFPLQKRNQLLEQAMDLLTPNGYLILVLNSNEDIPGSNVHVRKRFMAGHTGASKTETNMENVLRNMAHAVEVEPFSIVHETDNREEMVIMAISLLRLKALNDRGKIVQEMRQFVEGEFPNGLKIPGQDRYRLTSEQQILWVPKEKPKRVEEQISQEPEQRAEKEKKKIKEKTEKKGPDIDDRIKQLEEALRDERFEEAKIHYEILSQKMQTKGEEVRRKLEPILKKAERLMYGAAKTSRSETREEGRPAQNGNGNAIQKRKRSTGFRTAEEALQALAERQAKGLSSDPKSLQRPLAEGGNPTLLTFIYRWNQKHPEEPIEMKLLPTRVSKYESKEKILEALEKRRLEKGGSANYRMQLRLHIEEGGDRTLYQSVLRWNHNHPEDLIDLPLDPDVERSHLGRYQTKQGVLNALDERKKQGLGNSANDFKQTKLDGGDRPLLLFISHWNKSHPTDRIVMEHSDPNLNRLSPVAVWHSQTQNFKTTNQERTEWWQALQEEADHEAGKKLVESFIPSVNEIAQGLSGESGSHYEADLIQNGNMIVLETIYPEHEKDQWNPNRGVSITEFVETRLKKEMRRRTLQEIRSSGQFSIDKPYHFSDGDEKKWEPPSYDGQLQEVRINNLADERDEQSGLPVILFEEKHQIAREIGKWLIKKGFLKQVKQEGIQNLAVSMIGSLGVLGSAVRDKSDLNLMVVTDANESQAEALAEKLAQWVGGRYHEPQDSEPIRISVGKEGDYEQAIADGNGFISLLQRHKVGTDPLKGIASVEVIRIPDEDNSFSEDSLVRQKMRAAFHMAFQDPRLAEQAINGILVLENAPGAAGRLAKKLPNDQEDLFVYYERFLAKQAANLRQLQESSVRTARTEVRGNEAYSVERIADSRWRIANGEKQREPALSAISHPPFAISYPPSASSRAEVRTTLPAKKVSFYLMAEAKDSIITLPAKASFLPVDQRPPDYSAWRIRVTQKPGGQIHEFMKDVLGPRWQWYVPRQTKAYFLYKSLPQGEGGPVDTRRHLGNDPVGLVAANRSDVFYIPLVSMDEPVIVAPTEEDRKAINEFMNRRLLIKTEPQGIWIFPPVRYEGVGFGLGEEGAGRPKPGSIDLVYHPRLLVRDLGVRDKEVIFETSFDLTQARPPRRPQPLLEERFYRNLRSRFEKMWQIRLGNRTAEVPRSNNLEIMVRDAEEILLPGNNRKTAPLYLGYSVLFYLTRILAHAAAPLPDAPVWLFWKTRVHLSDSEILVETVEDANVLTYRFDRVNSQESALFNGQPVTDDFIKSLILEMGPNFAFLAFQMARGHDQTDYLRESSPESIDDELDEWLDQRSEVRSKEAYSVERRANREEQREPEPSAKRYLPSASSRAEVRSASPEALQEQWAEKKLEMGKVEKREGISGLSGRGDTSNGRVFYSPVAVGNRKISEDAYEAGHSNPTKLQGSLQALPAGIRTRNPSSGIPPVSIDPDRESKQKYTRNETSDKRNSFESAGGKQASDDKGAGNSSEQVDTDLLNRVSLMSIQQTGYSPSGRVFKYFDYKSTNISSLNISYPPAPNRAEVRAEKKLDSTWELREDAKKGRLAEMGKEFAPMIGVLWNRSEIKHRLGTDGFLPNLSKFIEIPKAEAAEAAIQAGLLIQMENSAGALALDQHLKAWQSRVGISSVSQENEVVILLEGAAFKLGLLAAISGISPTAPKVGVIAPKAYHALVEEVRNGLRTGQELIEGEKLPEILNQIAQMKQKPSRLTIWASKEDSFLTAAFIKRFLKDPNLNVEVKTVTQRDLDRANVSHPGFADRIKTFLAAVKSLSISA